MKWKLEKLGDVCDVRDGTHDSPKYTDSGYPLVTSKNIKNGTLDLKEVNYISEKDYNEINRRSKVDNGDILLPMIGTIGNPIVINEEPCFAIKNVCLIKHSEKLFNGYLYYILISDLFTENLLSQSRGGTQKFISLSDIRRFKIPLPPLPIQQKIAAILDEADALRRKDKALLAKYDELLQAVFYDMFGDPVKNEKGWEMKKFGDIYKSIRYGTGTPPIYQNEGIPFIRATNVKNGTVEHKGMVYVSIDDAKKIEKCFIKEGDLILVRSGVNTGDCARINREFSGALAGYDLIIEISEPYSVFYNYLINWPFGKKMIKPITRRAAQPHLNADQTENLEFYFPPINLQKEFSAIYFEIVNAKSQIIRQQTYSENLFQSLMQRAFKGDLVG